MTKLEFDKLCVLGQIYRGMPFVKVVWKFKTSEDIWEEFTVDSTYFRAKDEMDTFVSTMSPLIEVISRREGTLQ